MSQAAAASVVCEGCARTYRWKPELANKKGKCKCGGVISFPAADPGVSGGDASAAVAARPVPVKVPLETGGDGAYDVAESAPPPARVAPAALARMAACKGCTAMIPASAVICTRCGMNQQTGKKMGTQVKGASPEAAEVAKTAGIIVLALVAGGITSVLGAIVWLVIIYFTGYEIGLMAVAIGMATGIVIRFFARGGGSLAGYAAAGFAIFALALVKGVLVLGAVSRGMPPSVVFGPFDLLWVGLAAWTGYKGGSGIFE